MIKLYQNTYVLYIFLCCHNLIYTGFSHSLIAIVFTMHWTTFPTGHSETLQTNNLQLFKRKYKIKCIHIKLVHTDLVFISRFRRKMQNSHCPLSSVITVFSLCLPDKKSHIRMRAPNDLATVYTCCGYDILNLISKM